jgi:RNA polymerase sigma-70 factor (ECF subfamily)
VWWKPFQDRARPLPADLGERMESLWLAGRAAWNVEVPREAFAAHLAERWPPELPLDEYLALAAATDLYLACGCLAGVDAAVAAFDGRFVAGVRRYLRSLSLSEAQLDDLRQHLREVLLAGASRLAQYSGRGSLEGWFRVLALREAINLVHRERRRVDNPPDRPAADPVDDLAKTKYRAAFNAALREAISTLAAEERNLLRLHYLEGLTMQELAGFFGVHRTTIVRRVAEARSSVSDGMARRLRAALGLAETEFESLMKVMASQLDVSMSACFAEGEP